MEQYKHIVQYYETDKMGITHHSNYIRWMEEARVNFLENIGFSYKTMEDNGIVSPVLAVNCDYKQTTTFGDEIYIKASVAEFKGVRLTIRYEMTKSDGTLVCEAASKHCFMILRTELTVDVDNGQPFIPPSTFSALNNALQSSGMTALIFLLPMRLIT